MRKTILAVALLVGSANVVARSDQTTEQEKSFHTGIELLDECQSLDKAPAERTWKGIACVAYINGVNDGYSMGGRSPKVCLPENGSLEQYGRVVLKYLRDHPERLHEHKAFLTLDALIEAFPCSKPDPAP